MLFSAYSILSYGSREHMRAHKVQLQCKQRTFEAKPGKNANAGKSTSTSFAKKQKHCKYLRMRDRLPLLDVVESCYFKRYNEIFCISNDARYNRVPIQSIIHRA